MSKIKAAKSISLLWFGSVIGAACAFFTQIVLARGLGVEQFGAFTSAFVMLTLIGPLVGFGLSGFLLKAFGHEGWGARRWLRSSFHFLWSTGFLVFGLVLIWAWIGPHEILTSMLLTIMAIQVLAHASIDLGSTKFQLEGRHFNLAIWQFSQHFLRLFGVVVLVVFFGFSGMTAVHAAIAYAFASVVIIVMGLYQLRNVVHNDYALEGHGSHGEFNNNDSSIVPGMTSVLASSWPFGLASVFTLIYYQSDIVLLKYLADEAAVGMYSVAFVVMMAVYLFPGVVFQKFLLPRLHRWAYHDISMLHYVYRIGNKIMLFIGFFVALLILLISPLLLPWVFGSEYDAAVTLLMILSFAIPFRFLAAGSDAILSTHVHMKLKVTLIGVTAFLNIVLNLVLIPLYGALGAAVATVACEILLSFLYLYYINKRVIGLGVGEEISVGIR